MFEDKLQNLKPIRVDENDKQKDFVKIEQRLNKKPFYWQVPAVAFSMVLLVLFLVATMPITNHQANLSSDTYLQQVLFREGDGDPKSIYHIGVKRSTDEEELAMLETSLLSLEPVDKLPMQQKAFRTYRLEYSDGNYRVLSEYAIGHHSYFKDLTSGLYYKIAADDLTIFLMHTKSPISSGASAQWRT